MGMTKKCRICGRIYPEEAAFCGKCGVSLVKIEDTGKKGKFLKPGSTSKPEKTQAVLKAPKGAAQGQTEALLNELNSMIGLSSVKEEVQNSAPKPEEPSQETKDKANLIKAFDLVINPVRNLIGKLFKAKTPDEEAAIVAEIDELTKRIESQEDNEYIDAIRNISQ